MADLLPESTNPTTRIYVRWSDDGQHIRHWSREPFKHGLTEAQPVDAVDSSAPARIDSETGRPMGDHGTGEQAIDFILHHANDPAGRARIERRA